MMRSDSIFRGAGALFGGALLVLSGRAHAFDAQQFSPAVDPQGYFSVYSSQTAPRGRFHVGLWYDYAGDPIGFNQTIPGGLLTPPTTVRRQVDAVHTLDFVGSFSLLDWLEIGFDMPVSDLEGSTIPRSKDSTGIDDIRILGKVQLLRERFHGFGVGLVPFVDLPTGEGKRLTATGRFGGGGLAVGDFVYQRFRASLNGGYRVVPEADHSLSGFNDGTDEILFGAGAGVLAIKDQPILWGYVDNVEVLAEVFGATTVSDPFTEAETPAEGLGGVRLYSPSGLYLTAGIGKSITQSVNGAAVRVVASVGFSPPPPPPPPPPAPPPPPPPPPQPQVVETDEQIITLSPVYFDFDKDTIKKVSYPVLDQVAEVMRQRPTAVVRVEGHTDSFGSDEYNQKLSDKRAQAVVRYLIGKGIDASRLQAQGFGESRPVASNDTAAGRAKNRRTEFHIVREMR